MTPEELETAIEALPEPQRSAMRLRTYERASRPAIAARLGLREPQVERVLVAARIALADAAQRHDTPHRGTRRFERLSPRRR